MAFGLAAIRGLRRDRAISLMDLDEGFRFELVLAATAYLGRFFFLLHVMNVDYQDRQKDLGWSHGACFHLLPAALG